MLCGAHKRLGFLAPGLRLPVAVRLRQAEPDVSLNIIPRDAETVEVELTEKTLSSRMTGIGGLGQPVDGE